MSRPGAHRSLRSISGLSGAEVIRAWLLTLTLLLLPSPVAAAPFRVGVLDGSPPCSDQQGIGNWQGTAVDLWRTLANRERLPYVLSGYPNATALLEASRKNRVDIGVGCLTVSPERLGRYRFSLPFQEAGLAVLVPTNQLAAGGALLRSLLNLQLLRVIGLYLLLMAILSWLVWRDQKGVEAGCSPREQLRRYGLVFQVLATGPGTNVIVSRSRGHAMVVLCWVVRIVAASLIVSTITLDLLEQSGLPGFHPRSLKDLAGRRVAARAGSISAQLLQQPPLAGKVRVVSLPVLASAPDLLLSRGADAVLADEQQLRYLLRTLPASQRPRLQLVMQGTHMQSEAFALSPSLAPGLVLRIDRAISQAKREDLLP